MVAIHVTLTDGSGQIVEVPEGISLMEGLRAGGIADIEGICGGYCLCGTCHCYVSEADRARLPEQGEDEVLLLDGLLPATEDSRLMCQVVCTGELEGLKVSVAPRD